MLIDGQEVVSKRFPKMWKVEALNAGIRCGQNNGAPISFDYDGSFKFSGTVKSVEYTLTL